ncbi:MAG: hypothetical protein IPN03_13985 [Holophagales bacterium]|nr:hypothetical protein [Holophagales bacterium]
MRYRAALLAGSFFLSVNLQGQQPQPVLQSAPVPESPIVVYKVELLPTGFGFAMEEPKLEGDVYVFRTLPERTVSRLPKSRVKKISRWSSDLSKEVLWQVDLNPTGRMLSSKEPVKKGAGYVVTDFKQGTLMSVRETDVRKITRLTGLDAFKAHLEETGATKLEGELPPDAGSATVRGSAPASAPAAAPGGSPAPGNWVQQGTPGVSDAYAPPSAVQSRPGDVPKAAPTPK